MKTVLSTKKLTQSQRSLLLNAGIGLVEQDFIQIVPINFEIEKLPQNIIFTSKNAAKIVLEKEILLKGKSIFCVGDKTEAFLKKENLKVVEKAENAAELAQKIVEFHSNEQFLFFCGKKRRNELPEFLKTKKIELTEVQVYDTLPIPKQINRMFDGILFFSPSAVKSYASVNAFKESTAFCIGETTASEARKFTSKIVIANKHSIENVIVQVVKT